MARFLLLGCLCSIYAFGYHKMIESPYSGHQIEISIEQPVNPDCKLLVVLHGASSDGLSGINNIFINRWRAKDYAVACVSLPGYGKTTGKKDFCGPFTLQTLHFAIDTIKENFNVSNFGLIGFGQGGLASVLLSSERKDIKYVVCSNGGYDLLRRNDLLITTLQKKDYDINWNDDKALEYRSALCRISNMHAPMYILHRNDNLVVKTDEVLDFYRAMLQAKKKCWLSLKDKTSEAQTNKLIYDEISAEIENWIESIENSNA